MVATKNRKKTDKLAKQIEMMERVTSGIQTDSSSVLMPIECIVLPPQLNRYFVERTALKDLEKSIQEKGNLEQILVRPLSGDKYELISGYRIFLASQNTDSDERGNKVPVKILEVDEDTAQEISIAKNLLRENLNALEETEAILRLLKIRLGLENIDKVRHELYRTRNQINKAKKGGTFSGNVATSNNIKIINDTLAAFGAKTLESFISHRLGIVTRIQDDIKEVIRNGAIEYTKGFQIARIKEEEPREKFLAEVLAANPPYSERTIKIKVDEIVKPKKTKAQLKREQVADRFKQVAKSYATSKLSTQQETEVKGLLAQIEKIVNPHQAWKCQLKK